MGSPGHSEIKRKESFPFVFHSFFRNSVRMLIALELIAASFVAPAKKVRIRLRPSTVMTCCIQESYSPSKGSSPRNLSKSLWNKRSCTMRYFSNSVSACSLASSAVTEPAVCSTSLPPAAKMVSICLAQSSIVIGMWRLAIRSANSSTPFTNCPCL